MKYGLDLFLENETKKVKGKKIALLSHNSAITREGVPIHIAFLKKGVKPKFIFTPEHGFYGVAQDMEPVSHSLDPITGIKTISLYGSSKDSLKPSIELLKELDLLIIDLRDIGSRYYTYVASALWSIEKALKVGVHTIVLDSPNPIGGNVIEGGYLSEKFKSFVGAFNLPIRHGMTLGEIVYFFNKENVDKGDIEIVKVEGWQRDSYLPEWDLPWIAPSPNMPSFVAAILYPGICLFEGTVISEGRGTTRPFSLIGAPGIDPTVLIDRIPSTEGVKIVPTFFKPLARKFANTVCGGIEIVIEDYRKVQSVELGVNVLRAFYTMWKKEFWYKGVYEFVEDTLAIDLLAGGKELRESVEHGQVDKLLSKWRRESSNFAKLRERYLLYK